MKNATKNALVLGFLAAAMLFNAGCDSNDVAAVAVGTAIGVGLAVGVASPPPPPIYYRPAPPPIYYRPAPPPPGYYRPGLPRRCIRCLDSTQTADLSTVSDAPTAATSASEAVVADFATRHQISMTSAIKIKAAFDQAQTQGLSAFESVGLSQQDISVIINRSMPSDASIANMAQNLNLSSDQSRALLQSMVQDFSAQASDVNSKYWQACVAKTSWKTPQNGSCQSLSWKGCSPDSGATLCY